MNHKTKNIKITISAFIALIIGTFLNLVGMCYDSPCGDIYIGGGYVIEFASFSLTAWTITLIVIFAAVYSIWSILEMLIKLKRSTGYNFKLI